MNSDEGMQPGGSDGGSDGWGGNAVPPPPPPPPSSDELVYPVGGGPGGPAPTKRGGLWRFVGWVRLGIVGVVIIAGIVAYFARADRDGAGAIVEAGTVAASDMRVGDCFDMPDAQEFDEIRGVPCDDPHDVELFHLLDLSEWSAYPTDEQWVRQVADKCVPAFETYVGMAYETAEHLDIDWVVPTEPAWDNGDRAAACLLFRIDGTKLESSLRLG